MSSITISISEDRLEQLQESAARFGATTEDLLPQITCWKISYSPE